MLEAAVDLLRNEGLPSLTTVRVTREAGIVQSGFYAHFKNPEHLQREIAERTGRALREHMATWMAAMRARATDDVSLAASYQEILTLFREDSALIDLFLRFRRSHSPLGQVLGHLHTQLRADFFQYLREHAGTPEAIASHLGTIGVHADTLVAALLGVAEGIIDGRVADLASASEELAALTHRPLAHLMRG